MFLAKWWCLHMWEFCIVLSPGIWLSEILWLSSSETWRIRLWSKQLPISMYRQLPTKGVPERWTKRPCRKLTSYWVPISTLLLLYQLTPFRNNFAISGFFFANRDMYEFVEGKILLYCFRLKSFIAVCLYCTGYICTVNITDDLLLLRWKIY